MFNQISSILFATNLSESCREALDFAAAMATRLQAIIVLLQGMEKMPNHVEPNLRRHLDTEQVAELQ